MGFWLSLYCENNNGVPAMIKNFLALELFDAIDVPLLLTLITRRSLMSALATKSYSLIFSGFSSVFSWILKPSTSLRTPRGGL